MPWREVVRADVSLQDAWHNVKRFGAKGDGTTDDTAAVQSAIASLTNGGTVYFPEGRYILSPITMRKRIRFQGQHQFTTRLILKSGSNADFITFDELSQYCALVDLTIDGNRLNNTSGNAVRVLGTSTATTSGQPESTNPPTSAVAEYYNQLRSLRITDSPGSGLRIDFVAYMLYVTDIYIDRSVGYGIENYATDIHFVGIDVQLSGLANIYETGAANHWSNVKAIWSGRDRAYNSVDATAPGFHIDSAAAGIVLDNVEAQDNSGHGFLISTNQNAGGRIVLTGCWADRNSTQTTLTYNGFHITNSRGVTLSGCSATNYLTPTNYQNRPLYVDAASRDIAITAFTYTEQTRPPRIETPDYTWPNRETLGASPSTVDPSASGAPSFVRASTAYKADFSLVAGGLPRYETGKVGSAITVEEGTTNLFSSAESQGLAAPTAKSLGAATYTVSVKAGTGSIALSGGPTGTATLGAPRTFTLGSTTSVTFTPTGTVSKCQLEAKAYDTSWHIGGSTRDPEAVTISRTVLNPDEGTIELWFNSRDKKPGDTPSLFGAGVWTVDGSQPYLAIQWGTSYSSANGLSFEGWNGSGASWARSVTPTIVANTWYRVVARWSKTLNKTSLKVYRADETYVADEGAYVSTTPNFASFPTVYIGQQFNGGTPRVNALIDDLRVSNVWRSDIDIERPFLPTTALASPVDTLTTYRMGFDSDLTFGAGSQVPNISADRGDASVTLTAADATTQRFNTALTANRTVTLPSTSLTSGMYFDIVRQATGAFNLSVTDGTTTFANLTSPNQSARVAYTGSAWVLTWIPAWSGVSADRGNADVTLTTADAPMQRFNTQLTVNRTVTLPTANQVIGSRFRIVRWASTPGAFTLTVQTMSPTNKVMASSQNGWVEAMWDGSNWQLIGSGVIGTTTSL